MWFIFLAAVLVTGVPWLYENVFVHDDFDIGWSSMADFNSVVPDDIGTDEDSSLNLNFLNDGYVFSRFRIEDLEIKDAKVSADLITKGRILRDKQGWVIGFSGKLFSENATLNSKRIPPLRASFEIIGDELRIETLRLGRSYRLGGKIDLVEPFDVDLRLEIERADMRHISRTSKVKGRDTVFGIVSGSFNIKGALSGNIFSEGTIESRNGKISSVGYKLITLRLEGFGPIINIVDSNVSQDSGTLIMDGYVDLRNVAKGGLFDGVRIKSDLETIAWNGWDITKHGSDELSMQKDINEKMRVGFKTMTTDPVTTYEDREHPEEMSLEYKMGMENLKMKLRDNEEFFVIEHSVKF
ncbi:MAG: hypothetical protein KKG01_02790 [Candidatus Omnitrophica bacterium]|nr:hypothetical protein [Candidatus Omnitrophota bacterium]